MEKFEESSRVRGEGSWSIRGEERGEGERVSESERERERGRGRKTRREAQ